VYLLFSANTVTGKPDRLPSGTGCVGGPIERDNLDLGFHTEQFCEHWWAGCLIIFLPKIIWHLSNYPVTGIRLK